ncbi:MAG: MmoB/DmpM family protein [Hydrogenophaga sp.]|nr:MmoB/DmpM family protein [Hydrogenophaga sp.]MCB2018433.1 MmoB/DmpM family protein [Hydrogenophaga sp.]
MSNVFIAFQKNEETRAIVNAIVRDNPEASINEQPAMVRIDAPNRMVIRRETVADEMGRDFDLQEMHINLITLTGHIDETDDEFTLSWAH